MIRQRNILQLIILLMVFANFGSAQFPQNCGNLTTLTVGTMETFINCPEVKQFFTRPLIVQPAIQYLNDGEYNEFFFSKDSSCQIDSEIDKDYNPNQPGFRATGQNYLCFPPKPGVYLKADLLDGVFVDDSMVIQICDYGNGESAVVTSHDDNCQDGENYLKNKSDDSLFPEYYLFDLERNEGTLRGEPCEDLSIGRRLQISDFIGCVQ